MPEIPPTDTGPLVSTPTTPAEAAAALLADLDGSRLTVELWPARRPMFPGHMVRVATESNPAWYRTLARRIPPRGRPGRCSTGIRRDRVAAALRRMARGDFRPTPWTRLLSPLVGAAVCRGAA
jgi:hypothetical protein